MATSRRYELGVGILLLVGGGLFAWMAIQVGALQGPGNYLRVSAHLDSASGLTTGAVVSIAGVQVGRVESLSVDFNRAKLVLSLDEAAQIRSDVSLALRARSVLGEKYIELVPHSPEAPLLKEGDVIQDTTGAWEIDQMVNRLEPMLAAMDPASLQQLGATLSAAIAEDPERPTRMLQNADRSLQNLALASEELPGLIRDARASLATVQQVADEARPVIQRADQTLISVQARVDAIPPEELPALLADTRAAVGSAQDMVGQLAGHSDQIEHILSNVEEIDKWELRRLLREEGIVVRIRPSEVVVPPEEQSGNSTSEKRP
jgi:phospholipid/cholesterol/gamma-HCH transport system substrate-binding protein